MLKAAFTAIALAITALPAFAGNPAPAPADPVVIVEDTSSSAGDSILVPLLFLAFVLNTVTR
ncbi:hypothetical protein [Jannaschia marina]|uniref:hypothetical protein n=1 Tax=Jannaschia marina TaxID=2741674 RepID=UPI0015C763C6|nr:hypothetical protein [Jannaschia marina]